MIPATLDKIICMLEAFQGTVWANETQERRDKLDKAKSVLISLVNS